MSSVVVQEGVYPVAVEALNADVDEQQITRLNRAGHAVTPDVDDPDVLSLTPIEHVPGFRWRIFNGVENLHELLIDNPGASANRYIQ